MITKKHINFSYYWKLLKTSVLRFNSEGILTQSAALAYYMIFSLPPMLLIIFWSASLWYKEVLVREAIFNELGELIGKEGATQIMATLERITLHEPTWWATVIGVITLLFMASTVFVTIQRELNRIFVVKAAKSAKQGYLAMILDRFLSIAMLSIIGFMLTVSMVVSTVIVSFGEFIEKWVGGFSSWLVAADFVLLHIAVLTLLFALMYRYLPATRLKWRDTWFGGLLTALLFVGGNSLIEISIGNNQAVNFYDAAGSILVLMLWMYYASAIFYFGAIVTHCRSTLLGKKDS